MAKIQTAHLATISPEEMLAAIGKEKEIPMYNFIADEVGRARRAYVTQHPPTIETLRDASILGPRREPVTIIGPTGTGKELVAKLLHAHRSMNKDRVLQKMCSINCSGIVSTLFESQVFGHVKGAFTGAVSDSPGYLVSAGEGTAFFDEVGELRLEQQAKLLRVIETNKVLPVGAYTESTIHCRFVFATHRNLEQMVERGEFREDLYYRITPAILRTYSLEERPGDINLIAESICAREDWSETGPIDRADLKGNVRSLYNKLYRLNVLAK